MFDSGNGPILVPKVEFLSEVGVFAFWILAAGSVFLGILAFFTEVGDLRACWKETKSARKVLKTSGSKWLFLIALALFAMGSIFIPIYKHGLETYNAEMRSRYWTILGWQDRLTTAADGRKDWMRFYIIWTGTGPTKKVAVPYNTMWGPGVVLGPDDKTVRFDRAYRDEHDNLIAW